MWDLTTDAAEHIIRLEVAKRHGYVINYVRPGEFVSIDDANGEMVWAAGIGAPDYPFPDWSYESSAALALIDSLGRGYFITKHPNGHTTIWLDHPAIYGGIDREAPTLPLAICLAWLAYVDTDGGSND